MVKRQDFIKRSLEKAFAIVEHPKFSERREALQEMGMRAEVLDVVYNPETYLPAAASDGDYIRAEGDADDASIAVVALYPGETIRAKLGRHRLQGDSSKFIRTQMTQEDEVGALTITPSEVCRKPSTNEIMFRLLRPMLLLAYNDKNSPTSTMIMHHELFHVASSLNKSEICREDSDDAGLIHYLNEEFDAYDHQASLFAEPMHDYLCPTNVMAKMMKKFKYSQLRAPDYRVDQQGLLDLAAHETLGYLVPEKPSVHYFEDPDELRG